MYSFYKKMDELQRSIVEPYQKLFNSAEFANYQKSSWNAAQEIARLYEPITKLLDQPSMTELPVAFKTVQDFADHLCEKSYKQIAKILSESMDVSAFSSLADNLTFDGDFVELNETAVDILSPFVELPVNGLSDSTPPTDSPAPAKCKLTLKEWGNLLLTILAIILPMVQTQINEAINSAEQQRQWQIENEYNEELIAQNDAIIALLEQIAASQETDAEAHISLAPVQESVACTQSPADDVQTVPDESCAQQLDEQ